MFRLLLFVGFLAALSLSLEETQSKNSHKSGYARSLCCNISSGKTSFTTFLAVGSHPVRELFEDASRWCNSAVPDDQKGIAEASTPPEEDGRRKKRESQFHHGDCVESEDGQSMAYCVGYVKSQHDYICEYAGNDIAYSSTNSKKDDKGVSPIDSSHKQCTCISLKSDRTNNVGDADTDRKWWSCKCHSNNYCIVCRKGQSNSFDTKYIVLILLFVAVVFIIVAVILIIQKRKHAGRNEVSPLKTTAQNEAVPPGYESMAPDNRPPGGIVPIYTELEMTQQPTPSNSTTYASIQPTSEVVVIGKSVDYADLDFPLKDQQKPKSADKGTVSVSPIYSQPFEPTTSDNNTDYVEPFKPDKAPTATSPVQSQKAADDQQNVYSLAKAIPSGDPNVIYSEPNKPTKSSTPTGKADPIHLEVIDVKQRAGVGGDAKKDQFMQRR